MNTEKETVDQGDLFDGGRRKQRRPRNPQEWKIVALRDCPIPQRLAPCATPDQAAEYWRLHVPKHPCFSPEIECAVVLVLTTRRHIRGHYFVAHGTLDTLLVHPREVFRLALIGGASAVVLLHNHPSGDPSPSEADIRATRELIRAGQVLKVDLLDHIIIGSSTHWSLKESGHFQ